MTRPRPDRPTAAPAIVLEVRVVPRASTTCIAGIRDGALLVRLNAPPVDGAANAALVALLAREAGVPKHAIHIVSGTSSRRKQVRIAGADPAILERLLRGGAGAED